MTRTDSKAASDRAYTLAEVEGAIRESWSLDTAAEDDDWTPNNPSRGQCDITSPVVHDLLGGELLGVDVVLDGERLEGHMWIRLASPDRSGSDARAVPTGGGRRGAGRPTAPRRVRSEPPALPRYEQYLVLSDRVRARMELDR